MNCAYLLDRLADLSPGSPAIVTPGGAVRTWRETRERAARVAGGLGARGVRPGDRVAVLAPNHPHYLETYLALAWMGAVAVPLNTRLSSAELGFQVEDAGVGLWLVDASLLDRAAEVAPGLEAVLMGDGAPEARGGAASLEGLARSGPAQEDLVTVAPEATLGIFYTGGTTGVPKGVMLTHGNLLANALNVATAVDYRPGDIHLHAAPLFHLADLGATWALMLSGGAHAFLPRFSPEGFLEAAERQRITATVLAPVMVTGIVRSPDVARRELSAWRLLHYGGSPMAEETLARALEALPCGLVQGYGQTEATQMVCLMTAAEHRAAAARPALLRSCGRPVQGVQVRVAGEGGAPVRPGDTGEVIVRGPTVMKGYWNRPAETAEALRGGWLHTGDLATVAAEGFVYILDRKKDMIISGGENVFSVEVENALASHPAVLEAAVIGVPDDAWGERVHAVVVLAPGRTATPDELQRHCRALIGGYKVPRSVEIREGLPRTPSGKIRKATLREPYWRGQPRQVH